MDRSETYHRRPKTAYSDGTTEEQGVIARAELTALGYDVDLPHASEDNSPEGDS
ncbi:hypothetical protein ACFRR6_36385 [Streptomyces sp. NPDC056891]|uniref:hypothetical protein n=1 Tax=Streptomyces sp. NPDC056891 TaxID=3345961 RepID=UPI0036B3E04D